MRRRRRLQKDLIGFSWLQQLDAWSATAWHENITLDKNDPRLSDATGDAPVI